MKRWRRSDFQPEEPVTEAAQRRRLKGSMGLFLERRVKPDWMVTISFRDRVSRDGTRRPPTREWALPRLLRFLDEALEPAADGPILYILVEDYGARGGRFHAHALIAGVAHLDRRFWWDRASTLFGRTRIEPYSERGGGAQYIARHALTDTGNIHFGGRLLPRSIEKERPPVGRVVIARSAEVPSDLFHMTLGKWRQR
jgi:hypothetical protein